MPFRLKDIVWLSLPALAAPIIYTFSGDWHAHDNIPVVPQLGDSFSTEVIFDNGGSAIDNQTFVQSDFLSVALTSGAYTSTFDDGDISGWGDFVSGGSGELIMTGGFVSLNNGNDQFLLNQFSLCDW